jgi:hypothetical protein
MSINSLVIPSEDVEHFPGSLKKEIISLIKFGKEDKIEEN